MPSLVSLKCAQPAGSRPASAVTATLSGDETSTSETPFASTLNVTAAAGELASVVGSYAVCAAVAQTSGVALASPVDCSPRSAADSEANSPLAAGVAAPTPLTRVSRAPRSLAALNAPAAALADSEASPVWLDEPLHPARLAPAATAGASSRIAVRRLRPSNIRISPHAMQSTDVFA